MIQKSPKDGAKDDPGKKPESQPAHPPPEDEFGGGDFCSLEEETSTDDDKPLD